MFLVVLIGSLWFLVVLDNLLVVISGFRGSLWFLVIPGGSL